MSSGVTEVDMGSFAVLFSDCDPSQADDTGLPTNAYLVEYVQGETSHYDIVMSSKKVDIFDHYWDNYRHDFVNMTQAQGRISPKLWGNKPKEKSKKR